MVIGKEYKKVFVNPAGAIEVKTTHVIQKYLRFRRDKMNDADAFRERYSPVIQYWAERLSKSYGLNIVSALVELSEQDGDNIIKNLVTLRLSLECKNFVPHNA